MAKQSAVRVVPMKDKAVKSPEQNVVMERNGSILTIRVDLAQDFGPSASGKSHIVASTKGNVNLGENVFLGLNVYRKV